MVCVADFYLGDYWILHSVVPATQTSSLSELETFISCKEYYLS